MKKLANIAYYHFRLVIKWSDRIPNSKHANLNNSL
jgi:hypothetical protein